MKNIDTYILILIFADYTITLAQLVSSKLIPIERYHGRPIYGRWVYDLGFIFSIDEPFHIHYNPIYYISLESAKRSIDCDVKIEFRAECSKLNKTLKKLKVVKNVQSY